MKSEAEPEPTVVLTGEGAIRCALRASLSQIRIFRISTVMVDPNLKPARSGDSSELWRRAATVGQMSGGLTAESALRMLHLRWVIVALIAICCASPPLVQAQTRIPQISRRSRHSAGVFVTGHTICYQE
jgi:hypothetical protein